MEKTNFEQLEEIYSNFKTEQKRFINVEETEKLRDLLYLKERSRIECENLKQFNTLFYQHKISPVYNQIDKISVGDHIKDVNEFSKLLDIRDHLRDMHDMVDLTIENWIFRIND